MNAIGTSCPHSPRRGSRKRRTTPRGPPPEAGASDAGEAPDPDANDTRRDPREEWRAKDRGVERVARRGRPLAGGPSAAPALGLTDARDASAERRATRSRSARASAARRVRDEARERSAAVSRGAATSASRCGDARSRASAPARSAERRIEGADKARVRWRESRAAKTRERARCDQRSETSACRDRGRGERRLDGSRASHEAPRRCAARGAKDRV
jgi:hypothetical protein